MFVHLHVNHTCADFHISVDLYHISLDLYHDTSPSLIGDAADYRLYFLYQAAAHTWPAMYQQGGQC